MRSQNIIWQPEIVSRLDRSMIKNHRPLCVWITGLSSSGKSSISNILEGKLNKKGIHTYILDGDNIRHGLCKDLGFSKKDRTENVRRVAEVARAMYEAGLVTIVSLISPIENDRKEARDIFPDDAFFEVFLECPLEVCEARDPKGLYSKARNGEIENFTGIGSSYEIPLNPELKLNTMNNSAEECAELIFNKISSLWLLSI